MCSPNCGACARMLINRLARLSRRVHQLLPNLIDQLSANSDRCGGLKAGAALTIFSRPGPQYRAAWTPSRMLKLINGVVASPVVLLCAWRRKQYLLRAIQHASSARSRGHLIRLPHDAHVVIRSDSSGFGSAIPLPITDGQNVGRLLFIHRKFRGPLTTPDSSWGPHVSCLHRLAIPSTTSLAADMIAMPSNKARRAFDAAPTRAQKSSLSM